MAVLPAYPTIHWASRTHPRSCNDTTQPNPAHGQTHHATSHLAYRAHGQHSQQRQTVECMMESEERNAEQATHPLTHSPTHPLTHSPAFCSTDAQRRHEPVQRHFAATSDELQAPVLVFQRERLQHVPEPADHWCRGGQAGLRREDPVTCM